MNKTLANLTLAAMILALLTLHQDYWQWDNASLVWGFLPCQLVYHAGLSLLAAVVWFLAVLFCWPADLEQPTAPDQSE